MKLASIHVYPVKSLHGGNPVSAPVAGPGLVGDRRWMVTEPSGKFRTFRETAAFARLAAENTAQGLRLIRRDLGAWIDVAVPGPTAELINVTVFRNTLAARDAGDTAAEFLKAATSEDLRLVHMHDESARPVDPDFGQPADRVSFADGFPVLLANTASLEVLNNALASPRQMRLFRPNLVIEGAPAWAEDTWRKLRIGSITFRVVKPCSRCVMTTRDPDTGDQTDPNEPLTTLRQLHANTRKQPCFGQNLIPDNAGVISTGDQVEILETGASNCGAT